MRLAEDHAESIADQIRAMQSIEQEAYKCEDYLELIGCLPDGLNKSSSLEHHRQRICAWMYQLLDSCNYNREIVFHSMNFLDRFISKVISGREVTLEHFISGSQYELASLTALYMAMKLNGCQSHPVRICRFEVLSRRKFSSTDICKMEMKMLSALSWHVHPPCPAEYVEKYFTILVSLYGERKLNKFCLYQDFTHTLEQMQDIAMFLTELSVCDYYFVTEKSSITAFAAMLLAMENFETVIDDKVHKDFLDFLKDLGLHEDLYSVTICRQRLQELYAQNMPQMTTCEESPSGAGRGVTSPVSVSQFW